MRGEVGTKGTPDARTVSPPPFVEDELLPPHREPSPLPPPPPPSQKPKPKLKPKPAANLDVYRRLGAWVDVFDYALRDQMDPVSAVDEMARRGVRTLYLETSRWKEGSDIVGPEAVSAFLDRARLRGIAVVGWYVPGFVDMERDIRRSLAVLQFATPSGSRFSGLAPDLESREEVGGDQARFNDGITEYSRRLRAAVPSGMTLGAIVVDAKNNERSPARWEGYPWREIARLYDAVLPMAYWTATKKGASDCFALNIDTAAYMPDVVRKTEALMGGKKPFHLIGGVANCVTEAEVAGYVAASRQLGSLGGGLYDFATTEGHPSRDDIWSQLARLNH